LYSTTGGTLADPGLDLGVLKSKGGLFRRAQDLPSRRMMKGGGEGKGARFAGNGKRKEAHRSQAVKNLGVRYFTSGSGKK